MLPAPHFGARAVPRLSGRQSRVARLGEVLEPADGTRVLARHEDQFYAGEAAAVSRELGAGT